MQILCVSVCIEDGVPEALWFSEYLDLERWTAMSSVGQITKPHERDRYHQQPLFLLVLVSRTQSRACLV